MRQAVFFLLIVLTVFSSCTKDDPIPVPTEPVGPPASLESAQLRFEYRAVVNNSLLIPNTKYYKNASGDNFTISKLNYYISNIRLRRADGFVFVAPSSYHLIRHLDDSTSFTIENVAVGDYTSIEFLIGVDSLRNVSGVQTGALDPANNMFWDWNTGYIFFKIEGSYVNSTVPNGADYAIHVGGFTGKFNCLQTATLTLNTPIHAHNGATSKVYINTVVDEIFKQPIDLGFDYYYDNIGGPGIFQEVSLNYKDMFKVEKVEN